MINLYVKQSSTLPDLLLLLLPLNILCSEGHVHKFEYSHSSEVFRKKDKSQTVSSTNLALNTLWRKQ